MTITCYYSFVPLSSAANFNELLNAIEHLTHADKNDLLLQTFLLLQFSTRGTFLFFFVPFVSPYFSSFSLPDAKT